MTETPKSAEMRNIFNVTFEYLEVFTKVRRRPQFYQQSVVDDKKVTLSNTVERP